MGKISKEEQQRRDGMQWALRIAKEGGVEALEAECTRRGISDVPVGLRESEVNQFVLNVKENTIDVMSLISLTVLTDEFDFGKEQCERFKARFFDKTDCILGDYVTYKELIEQLQDDLDMKMSIRVNNRGVTVKA